MSCCHWALNPVHAMGQTLKGTQSERGGGRGVLVGTKVLSAVLQLLVVTAWTWNPVQK